MKQPVISIITVTFNAADLLPQTMQSVAEQTYPEIEYLIIDGASTDATVAVAKTFRDRLDFKLVSEPDRGLYDAMNKGLRLATGAYVWFLNAGDTIYAADTIERALMGWKNADLIYGDTRVVGESGRERGWYKPLPAESELTYRSFINGMVVCHQSMWMKRSIAQPYRLDVGLVADIDWCIRSLQHAETVKNTNLILSRFLDGGISDRHRQRALRERFRLLVHHFGWLATIGQHVKIVGQAIRRRYFKRNHSINE